MLYSTRRDFFDHNFAKNGKVSYRWIVMDESGELTNVEVSILGQRMVLRSSDDPAHVERVAMLVQRRADELAAGGTAPVQKLALLTALNIADDYLRVLEESREFRRQVVRRSEALLRELDESST